MSFSNSIHEQVADRPIIKIILSAISKYDVDHTRLNYKRCLKQYARTAGFSNIGDIAGTDFDVISGVASDFINNYDSETMRYFTKSVLNCFWEHIVTEYGYSENPIPPIKLRKGSCDSQVTYSDLTSKLGDLYEDREKSQGTFLACCIGYTLASTGLRISEVLQMNTSVVDTGVAAVRMAERNNGFAELQLQQPVVELLSEYVNRYGIVGSLFTTKTGVLIDRCNATRLLKSHLGFGPLEIRRSYFANVQNATV